MFISALLFIALLVGTLLYWNEFSGKTLRTYWSLLIGFILLPLFVRIGAFALIVQIGVVASFFAHAKLKSTGNA
jgi:hypothetical protein